MGIMSWDLEGSGFISPSSPIPRPRIPRITIGIRCEYPDTSLEPTEVSFALSPRYGIHNALEAHDWFLEMMAENEEFEVETDRAGEPPLSFYTETVRQVVVE